MDMYKVGEDPSETELSSSDNSTIPDINGVNKTMVRDGTILNCKCIITTDGLRSDIELINDLLYGIVHLNREILNEKIVSKISDQQIDRNLYNEIVDWLDKKRSIIVVKYLQYLSIACDMNFYQCYIGNHQYHGRIFVPIDQNHDIVNAIYYICDNSGQNVKAIWITDHSYINHINNRLSLQKHENLVDKVELSLTNIDRALRSNDNNEEIKNEQTIINKLIERRSQSETPIMHNIIHRKRADNCSSYNILSIDGGGIRGILAAIWLRELQRNTKRSSSSMFQMMAGTSTGAIIAVGLSAPDKNNRTIPGYDASQLVELYKTCGRDIFIKKPRRFYSYRRSPLALTPRYSSYGKRRLFERYFDQTLLCECLTDVVIPVVRSDDAHTHLFTRNNSLYSTTIVDVLMATTAAPTYFQPHILNNMNHIDGGVQMNNPTMAAYTKAIEYGYKKENIFILSLGTGDSIYDPLKANDHPDIIYYLKNRSAVVKVLIDSQQHNVDYQMSILMDDEHYYRWQVCFEELIELDKYEADTVNKLENIAYEYWEEMQIYDNNRVNRLIERLKSE
ncbi:unnamed protein product [Rotaria sp. Silwood2]|nr:unnamed protein product [Rotaria sp. Silwood2]